MKGYLGSLAVILALVLSGCNPFPDEQTVACHNFSAAYRTNDKAGMTAASSQLNEMVAGSGQVDANGDPTGPVLDPRVLSVLHDSRSTARDLAMACDHAYPWMR